VFLNDNSGYSSQFNPEEAKRILLQEGYAEGLTLNFYYPRNFFTRPTYVESIKTAFRKVGITLNITAFDSWKDLEEAMNNESSQVFIYGWGAEILGDAGNFLRTLFYSTSKTNFFHYNNKDVDNILDKALREKSSSLRDVYYREAVQRIMDDIPALFLMHVKEFYAYNKEKIKSVSISPYGIICYDKIILR
jgi:ABC-type transport system substrate-binding protein